MSVADSLLEELIAEPTTERYLVYADLLQTRGNPRGELIALALHAELTGTPATDRQRELEAQLTAALGDLIGERDRGGDRGSDRGRDRGGDRGAAKVQLVWERGFVRDLVVVANALPAITESGWLDRDAFALVRSLGIHDPTMRELPAMSLIAEAPFRRTLERVAFGFPLGAPPEADHVARLIAALPRLRAFELRARARPTAALPELQKCERLEELGLWTSVDERLFATLIDTPWPRLRALRLQGHMPPAGQLPSCLDRLLDGERHPELVELALMGCGFETELVLQLARRPLGKRLRTLGLDWRRVDTDTLDEVAAAFANIEIAWPRAVGMPVLADEEYVLARRLRVGLDRSEMALPHAERARELKPDDYYNWFEVGYTYHRVDRLEDAIRAMTRAGELDPKRWYPHTARGAALRDLSRFEEAEAAHRVALELAPTSAQIHNGLGLLYERWGRSDDAIAAYERAAELVTDGTDRAMYLNNATEVLVETGRLAEAVACHARAHAAAPTLGVARLGGYLRLYEGAPAEALAIAKALDTTDENDTYGARALEAAALRALDRGAEASRSYARICDDSDCPAWIGFAWLGRSTVGEDPFAAIAGVVDPERVADAIAEHVNASRGPTSRRVHETSTRTDDRIRAAVAALAGSAVAGRLDEARARARALAAYLAGPAPVKHNQWWMELWDVIQAAAVRAPAFATVIATAYRVATGRLPPSALDP